MKKTKKNVPRSKQSGVPKKLKDFVHEKIRQYAWEIGVSDYEGDIHYMAEPKEPGDQRDADDRTTAADVTVDHRYLKAEFRLYPDFVKKWESGERDSCAKIIAHEVAHLATEHIWHVATCIYKDEGEMRDAWEALTERLGRLAYQCTELKLNAKRSKHGTST